MKAIEMSIKLGKKIVLFTLYFDAYGWSVCDSNDCVLIDGGVFNCKREGYIAPLTISKEVSLFYDELIEMVKKAMKSELKNIIKERRF